MSYYEKAYKYLSYISYVLYIITFLGLWNSAPDYLEIFQTYLKFLISIVLIYYFNPFVTYRYNNVHKDIAFTAGIFLITSISFDVLINNFKKTYMDVRNIIAHPGIKLFEESSSSFMKRI
jgi:hypothetical protein